MLASLGEELWPGELDLALAGLPEVVWDGEVLCRRADRGGPLAAAIARMLAVAGELSMTSLLAGLHRTHATGKGLHWVDEQMVAVYLSAQPGYRIGVDGRVRAVPPFSRRRSAAVLTRHDKVIVAVARRDEETSYSALMAGMTTAGYRRGAGAALLARSPLLQPVGRGRYRLRAN